MYYDCMSPNQTVAIAIRIFALAIATSAAGGFLEAAFRMFNHYSISSLCFILASTAICMGCLYIWRFAHHVSSWILKDLDNAEHSFTSPRHWLSIGRQLLGLWFLGNGIPRILAIAIVYISNDNPPLSLVFKIRLISELVTVCIGAYLVLRTKHQFD